jgi:TolB-like protein
MTDDTSHSNPHRDPVSRYLDNELPHEIDAETFARCDAVIALAPKLSDSDDVGWAFEEARRLARSAPGTDRTRERRWYRGPWPAWTVAGILAVALLLSSMPRLPKTPTTDEGAEIDPATTAANITINQFVVSDEVARTLSEVEPVVLLANRTPVDSRSLAILPFTNAALANGNASVTAESIHRQVTRQLGAVPGVYLIDPATASVYSNYDMSAETIAEQLGVRGVVEGRIMSINGSVRFELVFTDAAGTGASLRESIERPSSEIALLESDIASTVVDALSVVPPPIIETREIL